MKQGDIIHKIYYRDHPQSDHSIEVLFETDKGFILYKDLQLSLISQAEPENWILFSSFNEEFPSDQQRTLESVRLDNEMALMVLLHTGDFIVVYFNSAIIIGVNSAQVLEIFFKDEVSETFNFLFATAKEIKAG